MTAHPKKSESEVMKILDDVYGIGVTDERLNAADWKVLRQGAFNKIEALYNQRIAGALGKKLAEDDVTDLKCSVCWRAPSRLYEGLFYCSSHFQDEIQRTHAGINKKEDV